MITRDELRRIIYRNSDLLRINKTSLSKFLLSSKEFNGGGKNTLSITYNDTVYKFTEAYDSNYYVLYSSTDFECVTVVIKDGIAEIHGIGNDKSCLASTNTNVGSTLLKITLKMLKKYKDKFKINKILLTDNSLKNCGSNNIKLSLMLVLLTGHTWCVFRY